MLQTARTSWTRAACVVLVALSAPACGPASVVAEAPTPTAAAPPAASAARAPYRTVVMIADTQWLVDGAVDPSTKDRRRRHDPGDPTTFAEADDREQYRKLLGLMDWILENREHENIDFVLHVGDAIEEGGRLPIMDECRDVCATHERTVRPPAPDEDGGWNCRCEALAQTRVEWTRFMTALGRLDGKVPYAVVRGNHDNIGPLVAGVPPFRDAPGYAHYLGEGPVDRALALLPELPGRSRAMRASTFVERNDAPEEAREPDQSTCSVRRKPQCFRGRGVSHAWRFPLGQRAVLVLGTHWDFGFGRHDRDERGWLEAVMNAPEYAALPVFALSHTFWANRELENPESWHPTYRRVLREYAPRIKAVFQGHDRTRAQVKALVPGHPVLYSAAANNYDALIHQVRFYLAEPPQRSSVEILARVFGFQGGSVASRTQTRLARQSFEVFD